MRCPVRVCEATEKQIVGSAAKLEARRMDSRESRAAEASDLIVVRDHREVARNRQAASKSEIHNGESHGIRVNEHARHPLVFQPIEDARR